MGWSKWRSQRHWSKLSVGLGGALSPVASGLVAEYKFDEGSGQTAADSSSNGYDLQLGSGAGADANDPTWGSEGLTFTTNDYCIRNTPEADLLPAAFTVTVVGKTSSLNAKTVVGWDATNDSNGVIFTLTGQNSPNIYLNATQRRAFAAHMIIDDNAYHCVTFTMPGNAAADILTSACYVNTTAATAGFTLSAAGSRTKTHFLVGRSGSYYFEGTMAWLLFYNRALTSDEVSENYTYLQEAVASKGVTLP